MSGIDAVHEHLFISIPARARRKVLAIGTERTDQIVPRTRKGDVMVAGHTSVGPEVCRRSSEPAKLFGLGPLGQIAGEQRPDRDDRLLRIAARLPRARQVGGTEVNVRDVEDLTHDTQVEDRQVSAGHRTLVVEDVLAKESLT